MGGGVLCLSAQRKKRSTGPSYHSQYRMRTCLASLAQAPCPDVRARALLGLAAEHCLYTAGLAVALADRPGPTGRLPVWQGRCCKAHCMQHQCPGCRVLACSRARVRVRVRVLNSSHAPPKTDAR